MLLEDAEVLEDAYADYGVYDAAATRARLTARRTDDTSGTRPAGPAAPPARFPSAHEQAAHDLGLAVSLVLNAPEAAAALTRLVEHDRIDPQGAVVFAALLHLTGHRDAAQFWWQFAAGGGNRTAAFCLFLAHRQRAEFRDAAHWRDQSRRLPGSGRTVSPAVLCALLPETVGHDLLSQCHEGRRPTLPASLEAVINRLRVDGADEDFGEVPRPDPALPRELSAGPAAGPAGRRAGDS
ncbi:hypothetical protein DVH02_05530 [Streptomyces corynorhini]|uniref:Uncharacterized protein n=1 Tax=Streptomyces corynorhini TaxID=2282652 RepID=A0A370BEQ1_9ACTN|nr:hypothetical protein DVH02_05530 [Streptomyces corynorhini]